MAGHDSWRLACAQRVLPTHPQRAARAMISHVVWVMLAVPPPPPPAAALSFTRACGIDMQPGPAGNRGLWWRQGL